VSGPNGVGVLKAGFDYRLGLAPFGTAIALGGPDSDLVAGDFNGDGRVDLAFLTRGPSIGVLLGDGTGAFPKIVMTSASGHSLFGLACADLDGDGHLDAVATDIDNSQVLVFHGDGSGNLSNVATISGVGPYPESLSLADFNEDHILDAGVVLFGSGTGTVPSYVRVLLGDGSGGFQAPGKDFGVLNGPQQLALVADPDGHLDIFTNNVQSAAASFLRGKGDGTFDAQVAIPMTANTALAAADFNRTGRVQVLVVSAISFPVLVSQDQTGNFQTTPIGTSRAGHQNCVAVDLNRDGWPDVVAMASKGNQHSVFLNDRKGGFVEYLFTGPVCGGTPTASGKMVAVDFDGDGRIDIAIASAIEDSLTIYLNK
jgi:hypothetical protein